MRQLVITKQITLRNENSINRYFQEINKYPMISAEEEAELSLRIRQGDSEAMEKLVVSNLRFVVSVAKQYQNQGLSFSDLINEGNLGLVKAAGKFDETRGFKFISYAVWWIRQAIVQAIAEQNRIVRLPLNRVSSINKIAKAIPFLEQELEREPTDKEISDFLEIPEDEVSRMNFIRKKHVSFDKPLSSDGNDEFCLYDLVQTGNVPSTDNDVVNESTSINISRALSKLSKRESDVLVMSFGLFNSPLYSLQDISAKFYVSSERIRQIRAKGLLKLRNLLKNKSTFLEN